MAKFPLTYILTYCNAGLMTLAIIARHPTRSSVILATSAILLSPPIRSNRLSMNFFLCLPRALFPSIFPIMQSYSMSFARITCPTNCICLFVTSFISHLLTPALLKASSFVTLAVHGIRSILLTHHISNASIFFIIFFLAAIQEGGPHKTFHHSHSYVHVHAYVCAQLFYVSKSCFIWLEVW